MACVSSSHTLQTALQLLEKSTHEKQDTIVELRKQLEEMKLANLKIQTQLKVMFVYWLAFTGRTMEH